MFSLKEYLCDRRKIVNQELTKYFVTPSKGMETIYKAVMYSLNAGGKRIRPILALATAEALHQNMEKVLSLACALEMIHTYSLIHDDLPAMDNDDTRRGNPTNHKVFGEAGAILAGDALLTKSFEVLTALPGERALWAIKDVAIGAGIDGMVGGQMMDLEAENKKISYEQLEQIHRHKTAALLCSSVTASAKVCGANEGQLENFHHYGVSIGLAFQIADDVLDIEGGEEIGKDRKSDLNKDKATYPKLLGIKESKHKAKELVSKALHSLESFDEAARPLREIANYIINRNH